MEGGCIWSLAALQVKLYAAVQDRSVHFCLRDAQKHLPVEQYVVRPQSGAISPSTL